MLPTRLKENKPRHVISKVAFKTYFSNIKKFSFS